MTIGQRYASAIHSHNLTPSHSERGSVFDDVSVLCAMGIADRTLSTGKRSDGSTTRRAPLAAALTRLFSGDNKAAKTIVSVLVQLVLFRAEAVRVKLTKPTAHDMACSCLAWFRNGRCRACNGHGRTLMPGTGLDGYGGFLSDHDCQACFGTGLIPLERNFRQEYQQLARWLVSELERESGRAGPEAMRSIGNLEL